MASIVSEHIVEPELFEEALELALDTTNDTLLGVNTILDGILDMCYAIVFIPMA